MVEVVDAAPKIVVLQLKPRREVERVITLPPWLPSFCMSVGHTAFPPVDPMQPISNSYERASHLRRHGSPFPFDVDCISLPKQVRECLKSLNELAGTKFNDIQQLPHRPPTLVQQTMIKHVDQCITGNGATPTDMSANQAISDLMRSFTPYDGTPSHLTEFCFEKIKILGSSVKPKKLLDLLPSHVKPFVQDFHLEGMSASDVYGNALYSFRPEDCPACQCAELSPGHLAPLRSSGMGHVVDTVVAFGTGAPNKH